MNPFESDRFANAAKRAQRENSSLSRGRGGGSLRGRGKAHTNIKQVRFAESPTEPPAEPPTDSSIDSSTEEKMNPFASAPSTAPRNPFDTAKKPASAFGAPSAPAVNPFAPKQDATTKPNPFGAPSQATITPSSSIFGAPSTTPNGTPPRNPFGAVSQPSSTKPATSVFGKPSSASNGGTPNGTPPPAFEKPRLFGAPSATPANNPFGKPAAGIFGATPATSSPFGVKSNGSTAAEPKPSPKPALNPFATASKPLPASSQTGFGTSNGFGSSKPSSLSSSSSTSNNALNKSSTTGAAPKALLSNPRPQTTPANTNVESSDLAKEIYQTIRRDRITPPTWPKPSPGDPKFKPAIEAYWKASKVYRSEVRASLIRANLLDDPDKPKKLSEAIDFKGICEEMCPDFEKATRIYERDYKQEETENGVVAPHKMIKALARSAAGQDAPLPMDVRSPGALRRTLDYLFNSVLGNDEDNLPNVHHFLWDRTRAIRRDFVFQSSTMNSKEMLDQVYCLERIVRFHVISLHQMSKEGVAPAEEFSEQQEVEQLSKALLSLKHSYDDCDTQNITCENESEFRAYYALFNAGAPGMLQTVQDWGHMKFRDSDDIQTAISLVETLQNIWDLRGPLTPQSATDIAQNSYAKFFTILEDKQVSYTMACFAEIHFNYVRKSILKTILASYRKQRDQTKDWTLSKLNAFLRFDDENDIIAFGEQYGLRFDEADGGDILSFESDEGVKDPHPPAKQAHSYNLVEHKRGNYSLPEAIDEIIFDETSDDEASEEEEEGLFVTDEKTQPKASVLPKIADAPTTTAPKLPSFSPSTNSETQATKVHAASPPASILNNGMSSPKPSGADLFSRKAPASPVGTVSEAPSTTAAKPSSFFPKPLQSPGTNANKQSELTPSVSTFNINSDKSGEESPKPTASPKPSSMFNFKAPTTTAPSALNTPTPPTFGSSLTSAPQTESPKAPLFFPVPPKSTTPSVTGSGNSSQVAGQKLIPPLGQTQAFTPKVPSPLSLPAQVPPTESPSSLFQPSVASKPSAPPTLALGTQEASPSNALSVVKKPHPYGREAQLTGLTNWMALGEDGIVDHFVSYNVENALMKALEIWQKERAEQMELEKANSDRVEADAFRYRFIATKYFNYWRTAAYHLFLRRRGREGRQARLKLAESSRASKAALSANLVEDFKAAAIRDGARRRESMQSLLGATGVLDGVHDQNEQVQSIVREEAGANGRKRRQRPDKVSKPDSSATSHKRVKSDDPLRRTMLSDPSYLAGGSRYLLLGKCDPWVDKDPPQVSGVQTDYFRLKARGIFTRPGRTPSASSVANNTLRQKRSYDELVRQPPPQTPPRSRCSSMARSVPSKTHVDPDFRLSIDGDEHVQALKKRAQAVMDADSQSRRKRSFTSDDDEALFERARKVREQMDEGMKWYREERKRASGSRSVSGQ